MDNSSRKDLAQTENNLNFIELSRIFLQLASSPYAQEAKVVCDSLAVLAYAQSSVWAKTKSMAYIASFLASANAFYSDDPRLGLAQFIQTMLWEKITEPRNNDDLVYIPHLSLVEHHIYGVKRAALKAIIKNPGLCAVAESLSLHDIARLLGLIASIENQDIHLFMKSMHGIEKTSWRQLIDFANNIAHTAYLHQSLYETEKVKTILSAMSRMNFDGCLAVIGLMQKMPLPEMGGSFNAEWTQEFVLSFSNMLANAELIEKIGIFNLLVIQNLPEILTLLPIFMPDINIEGLVELIQGMAGELSLDKYPLYVETPTHPDVIQMVVKYEAQIAKIIAQNAYPLSQSLAKKILEMPRIPKISKTLDALTPQELLQRVQEELRIYLESMQNIPEHQQSSVMSVILSFLSEPTAVAAIHVLNTIPNFKESYLMKVVLYTQAYHNALSSGSQKSQSRSSSPQSSRTSSIGSGSDTETSVGSAKAAVSSLMSASVETAGALKQRVATSRSTILSAANVLGHFTGVQTKNKSRKST